MSSGFELDNIKIAAILRDFLNFCTWQHQKRNNSTRLLQFLNSTTSKTKQFCEASFKNEKLSAALTTSYQCVLHVFPLHLSKVLRLPRKSDARSYEVLHLSRKIILTNLQIWCSKMQRLSGNQRPDLARNASLQFLFKCPTPVIVFGHAAKPSRFAHIWEGAQPLAPATRNDILACKSGPNPLVFFNILTSKCASCHNGVHFFDISTSKSDPDLVCFVHLDFEICFAPQRRALFRHLNFQKWSGPGVFCTFWLRNVLHATEASTFSTFQLPKVFRTWGVFSFFTCTCTLRHNSVHFFISHLARWLRTRHFSKPTFRPSGAPNHWKNPVFRDFPTFSCIWASFCWFFPFWSSLFYSSLLSDSSRLCFSSVHIVGSLSLTSKLPSIIWYICIYIIPQ